MSAQKALQALSDLFGENELPMSDRNAALYETIRAAIAAFPPAPPQPAQIEVLVAYDTELRNAWGAESDPHAYAYGKVKMQWTAALAAQPAAQGEPDCWAILTPNGSRLVSPDEAKGRKDAYPLYAAPHQPAALTIEDLKAAFYDGFLAPETYNDKVQNDIHEEWAKWLKQRGIGAQEQA